MCDLHRQGKNQELTKSKEQATAHKNRIGRTDAISGDTKESINSRHDESTHLKQGAGHNATWNPALQPHRTQQRTTAHNQNQDVVQHGPNFFMIHLINTIFFLLIQLYVSEFNGALTHLKSSLCEDRTRRCRKGHLAFSHLPDFPSRYTVSCRSLRPYSCS
jgi:hypothetical protein